MFKVCLSGMVMILGQSGTRVPPESNTRRVSDALTPRGL